MFFVFGLGFSTSASSSCSSEAVVATTASIMPTTTTTTTTTTISGSSIAMSISSATPTVMSSVFPSSSDGEGEGLIEEIGRMASKTDDQEYPGPTNPKKRMYEEEDMLRDKRKDEL